MAKFCYCDYEGDDYVFLALDGRDERNKFAEAAEALIEAADQKGEYEEKAKEAIVTEDTGEVREYCMKQDFFKKLKKNNDFKNMLFEITPDLLAEKRFDNNTPRKCRLLPSLQIQFASWIPGYIAVVPNRSQYITRKRPRT